MLPPVTCVVLALKKKIQTFLQTSALKTINLITIRSVRELLSPQSQSQSFLLRWRSSVSHTSVVAFEACISSHYTLFIYFHRV